MMRLALPLSILVASLAAGACAMTETADNSMPAGQACFMTNQITNWKPLAQNRGVAIRTSRRDVYTANFDNQCPDLQTRVRIGIRSRGASRAYLCEGDDATVYTTANGAPLQCEVHNLHRLNDSEMAGLSREETP